MPDHAEGCTWPASAPCLQFSTDGTRLGAEIAHTMGTSYEEEITRLAMEAYRRDVEANLTGMPEEQAEWEETNA